MLTYNAPKGVLFERPTQDLQPYALVLAWESKEKPRKEDGRVRTEGEVQSNKRILEKMGDWRGVYRLG